jgi:hypothetical protein
MSLSRRSLFAAIGFIGAIGIIGMGGVAFAQAPAPAPTRVRGVVDAIDAQQLHMTTRAGQKIVLKLADGAPVRIILPIAIDAIRPGSFIGTAAVSQPDGTLKALEIQVFPEAMRGVGEGHRPWDLGADSSMTNGTVGDLTVANGRYLTLAYKGGEQKVFVPENAPIITYEKGSLADVKPGLHVIVTATHGADETLTATQIGVGKDGLVPPM